MKLTDFVSGLLFPQRCASCLKVIGKRNVFCGNCMPEIPFVEGEVCKKCGIALPSDFPSPICGRCRRRNFHFDKSISLLEHFGQGRQTVLNMKYKSYPVIKDMALLLSGRISGENELYDIVTFVPMTKKDEREKKIHITYFLSKEIAKYIKCSHAQLLEKVKETKKQKDLTENERILNVRGAYAANGDVKGKSILLVDDVFTTGATMDECAKVLKRAGAVKVCCATVSIRDRE